MYDKLREIRKIKNISVEALSNAIGKSTKSYYKRESGKIKFSISEAKIISEVIKMPMDEIFFDIQLSKIESEAV